MSRPKGMDHFLNYLKGLENDYVIGGGAASILMDDSSVDFRATKDVDLVLLTNESAELNNRIAAYVDEGKYEIKEATDDAPRYYRFRSPKMEEFPVMIEIFGRNEQKIELRNGQYIIPVENDEFVKISAILLDEEYFSIIRSNLTRTESGASVINFIANICLKARAHRELTEKKESGDQVDDRAIKKHRNDIFRIAPMLRGDEVFTLSATPKKDLTFALEALKVMPENQFKEITEAFPGTKKLELISLIEKVFNLI
jgi:hypothetical protein